jgi:hypothetical protein
MPVLRRRNAASPAIVCVMDGRVGISQRKFVDPSV